MLLQADLSRGPSSVPPDPLGLWDLEPRGHLAGNASVAAFPQPWQEKSQLRRRAEVCFQAVCRETGQGHV